MPQQPSAEVAALPQRFDVWQADARALPLPLPEGAPGESPWMLVVASETDDQVLAYDLARQEPTADALWETLCQAMLRPETSEPHRPTEIQLRRPDWCEALRGRLDALNIGCTAVEELPEVEEVLTELGGQLEVQTQPGLLDMPGLTPEAVGSFFDAAAHYYEQAPWKKTGERPIQVEAQKYSGGPWYAVLIGQGGMASGLILYDSLEMLRRVQQDQQTEEENARQTSALVIAFGEPGDLPDADLQAIQKYHWPIAGPEAYPSVYRLEPGLSMRPPLAWELELLEGCLRAMPEFLRKKTRRLAPLALTVPVAGGATLDLVLAWEG